MNLTSENRNVSNSLVSD